MDHNKCRHLLVDEKAYAHTEEHLLKIFNTQVLINLKTTGLPDYDQPLSEVLAFMNTHYHGLQDELREVFQALGGMDSHGSAVWKTWKASHKQAGEKTLSDLSPGELLELQYELVDCLKFLVNMMLAVGMSAETMFNLFMAKTAENNNRLERGY